MRKPLCVVVPAYNEAKVIESSLNALYRVIPKEDVYIISDGSRDGTGLVARSHGDNVVESIWNFGKASALNFLIKLYALAERYDYIFFFDADSQIEPGFVEEVQKYMVKKPACIVGTVSSHRHGFISAYRVYEYGLSHKLYKKAQDIMKVITVAPGCASLYRSDVIEKLDFSNTTLTEDFDLTIQIHKKKLGDIVFAPKARVITQDPPTIKDYWKQIMRWYTGFWQNFYLHKLYKPNTKISLELYITTADVFYWLIGLVLALQFPYEFMVGFLTTAAIMAGLGVFIIALERQWWALKYTPFFPLFQFVNLGAYLVALVRGTVKYRQALSWQKVERYATV